MRPRRGCDGAWHRRRPAAGGRPRPRGRAAARMRGARAPGRRGSRPRLPSRPPRPSRSRRRARRAPRRTMRASWARHGREDHAVHPPRGECAALCRLDLGIAVGVGDEHGVAVAPRAPHDGLCERRRERVHGVGDDQPERAGGLLLEGPRDLVRAIAELRDRGLDARARARGHRGRVADDVRHGRLRDAGAAGHVVERHCHESASRSATAEASIDASGVSDGSSCSIETTPS